MLLFNIIERKLTIMLFTSKKEYIDYFRYELYDKCNEEAELEAYLNSQLSNLEKLTANISKETFWEIFPEILGIDAKLNLLVELSTFEDFSKNEIIRIIENDYKNYFKELCGYDLSTKTRPSMIFNIN